MEVITWGDLTALSAEAAAAPRKRRNRNLHPALEDPIQRLFNALEPGTYVRPHRHDAPVWELFTVPAGAVRVLTFDDDGTVRVAVTLGPQGEGPLMQLAPGTWHSLVALEPGSMIFEVKPGPYRPASDKDFSAWAPKEGEPGAPALEAWMRTATPGDRWPG